MNHTNESVPKSAPLFSEDNDGWSQIAKLIEGLADILIEAAPTARQFGKQAVQHQQQQALALLRIADGLTHQQRYLNQFNEGVVGLEQTLSVIAGELGKLLEHNGPLAKRIETLAFNTEQVRLLAEANAQKQQQLVDNFIERHVTDRLYQKLLDIQFTLVRYTANGSQNLMADILATAENIESFLFESGLLIINPAIGSTFDPREHLPIKVLTTSNTQSDETIAETFTPGLSCNHRVVRQARVAVFKVDGVKPTN